MWTMWEAVGEMIRKGAERERGRDESVNHGETHESLRPHLRRAHWQVYWTGRKKWKEGVMPLPQVPVLKWKAPVPVAMANEENSISEV